jgi:hypothetical protein
MSAMDQEEEPAVTSRPEDSSRHDEGANGKVRRLPHRANAEIALALDELVDERVGSQSKWQVPHEDR